MVRTSFLMGESLNVEHEQMNLKLSCLRGVLCFIDMNTKERYVSTNL